VFERAYKSFHIKNEARIIQDISRLLVTSAETLSLYDKELRILTESVNEGWNNSIPLTGTRPQPDYSVGFPRAAFTDGQLAKLSPFIGDFVAGDMSFFMATYYMYFPFLSCEVKCGAAALDVADRQNAHSMNSRGTWNCYTLTSCEAGEGGPPVDLIFLRLVRRPVGADLRLLSCDRRQGRQVLSPSHP
jgi:hypothetical protein